MNVSKFQTVSGRLVDVRALRPQDIDIRDIAWSLAMQTRYLGHSLRRCSVAEHSCLVAAVVGATDPELYMQALLHDAAEAYTGDLPPGLKELLPDYRALQHEMQTTIFKGLRIAWPDAARRKAIKFADLAVRAAEREQCLVAGNDEVWSGLPPAADVVVRSLDAKDATRWFLANYLYAKGKCGEQACNS